ncbi:helix-turn-helix transcriptional regulator [Microbacterium enclense]|uniref:helix-turn-helix transcriptional regulator n=1 Tax=Microbacterium enclense TaxID=993073 RepID=UPI0034314F26
MVRAWISSDRFLSPEMVCEMVPGMTKDILAKLRESGRGAPWCKPSLRTVIYLESDIVAWVLSSRRETRDSSAS